MTRLVSLEISRSSDDLNFLSFFNCKHVKSWQLFDLQFSSVKRYWIIIISSSALWLASCWSQAIPNLWNMSLWCWPGFSSFLLVFLGWCFEECLLLACFFLICDLDDFFFLWQLSLKVYFGWLTDTVLHSWWFLDNVYLSKFSVVSCEMSQLWH